MKNYKLPLATMLLSLAITSCGGPSSSEIEAVPFKADEDDRWGIIDWEGNVIIEDEFDEAPSVVREGLFYIKNKDGEYEFYTADKEFKQVGETYKEVAHFNNGLAPVVKKNERIKFINTDGEVQFELTQHEGKEIVQANRFSDGRAIIINEEEKYGFINTDGEVILAPKYYSLLDFKNGYTIAIEKGKDLNSLKSYILDTNGEVCLAVDDKMLVLDYPGEDGLIPFFYVKDAEKNEPALGYIDMDGEIVIQPNKKFESGSSFQYGYAIVKDGSDYGIIDKNGETIIRPKYDEIVLFKDKFLFKDERKWGVMNYEGETLVDNDYIQLLAEPSRNTMFAYSDDGSWTIIDNEGKEINKESYDKIYKNEYEPYSVQSDFVDIVAEAQKAAAFITDKGFGKLTFNMTPAQAAAINKFEPNQFVYRDQIPLMLEAGRNLEITARANYGESVAEANYGTYASDITYQFRNLPCKYLSLEISVINRLSTKDTEFFTELNNAVAKAGFKAITPDNFKYKDRFSEVKYYQKGNLKISVGTVYDNIYVYGYIDK